MRLTFLRWFPSCFFCAKAILRCGNTTPIGAHLATKQRKSTFEEFGFILKGVCIHWVGFFIWYLGCIFGATFNPQTFQTYFSYDRWIYFNPCKQFFKCMPPRQLSINNKIYALFLPIIIDWKARTTNSLVFWICGKALPNHSQVTNKRSFSSKSQHPCPNATYWHYNGSLGPGCWFACTHGACSGEISRNLIFSSAFMK